MSSYTSDYISDMIKNIFDKIIKQEYDNDQLRLILDFARDIETSFDYYKTYKNMEETEDENKDDYDELMFAVWDYYGVLKNGPYYYGDDIDSAFCNILNFIDEDDQDEKFKEYTDEDKKELINEHWDKYVDVVTDEHIETFENLFSDYLIN